MRLRRRNALTVDSSWYCAHLADLYFMVCLIYRQDSSPFLLYITYCEILYMAPIILSSGVLKESGNRCALQNVIVERRTLFQTRLRQIKHSTLSSLLVSDLVLDIILPVLCS